MNPESHMSRRRFLLAGGGAALLGLAGGATAAVSDAATTSTRRYPGWDSESFTDLRDLAYCILLQNGGWVGPRSSDGRIDPTMVNRIVSAARRSHAPQYLRYTECNSRIGSEVPTAGTQEYSLTRQLVDAGCKLGVAINVALEPDGADVCMAPQPSSGPKKPYRCVRSFDGIIEQAAVIKADSDAHGGIYDWIFLDFAWDRTPAGPYGLDDLQQIIDTLARVGWSRVMINASGFGPKHFQYMPSRTWAMAHRFQLFVGNAWETAAQDVVTSRRGALQAPDLQFVDYVRRNRRGCRAILKLEDPSETQRFAMLTRTSQDTLLKLWAQQSNPLEYRMIYPIFIDGNAPLGNQKNEYDSLAQGTFTQQLELMRRYG